MISLLICPPKVQRKCYPKMQNSFDVFKVKFLSSINRILCDGYGKYFIDISVN